MGIPKELPPVTTSRIVIIGSNHVKKASRNPVQPPRTSFDTPVARPGVTQIKITRPIDSQMRFGPLTYAKWDREVTKSMGDPKRFEWASKGFDTVDKILALTDETFHAAGCPSRVKVQTYFMQYLFPVIDQVQKRFCSNDAPWPEKEIAYSGNAFFAVRRMRAMLATGLAPTSLIFQKTLNDTNRVFAERGIKFTIVI